MPRANRCTGSLRSKLLPTGDGHGVRQRDVSREALSRLPKLDIRELREEWRRLYKTDASRHLSRELLIRAVAHRTQEVALGGLRPELQRQLRQIAIEVKQTGGAANVSALS